MTRRLECAACQGEGSVDIDVTRRHDWSPRYERETCPCCAGWGDVRAACIDCHSREVVAWRLDGAGLVEGLACAWCVDGAERYLLTPRELGSTPIISVLSSFRANDLARCPDSATTKESRVATRKG